MSTPVAVVDTALVTSVGLSAPAACAAIRAGLTNPSATRYIDSAGEWIMAHQVPLDPALRGRAKLITMATMAIRECLAKQPLQDWATVPLMLCVAEQARPGRFDALENELFAEIEAQLEVKFARQSLVIPHGRVSVAVALMHARELIASGTVPYVLIAATDTLLNWPTLQAYDAERRLLTQKNSNGFMAGEGAGALLIGPVGAGPQLSCTGLGFATEPAPITSEEPLRGDGLTQAIKGALKDAGCEMHHMDFRITDVSGEQYYFKEAALALSRTLRELKEEFDIWHPAECIGEAGAVAGVAAIAVADAACRKAYAHGPNILCHAANDDGRRAAIILQYRTH